MGRPLSLDIHQAELWMHSETHLSLPVKLSLDFPCFSRYWTVKTLYKSVMSKLRILYSGTRRSRSPTDERTEGISRRVHILAERLFTVAQAIDALATAPNIKLENCLMYDRHTGHITVKIHTHFCAHRRHAQACFHPKRKTTPYLLWYCTEERPLNLMAYYNTTVKYRPIWGKVGL